MLSLWRRHTEGCEFKDRGRTWTKCSCPIWVDGEVNGERIRCSTDTRDWKRAGRRAADFEDAIAAGRKRKLLPEAVASFLASLQVQESTKRKATRVTRVLMEFAATVDVTWVDEFTLEKLDGTPRGAASQQPHVVEGTRDRPAVLSLLPRAQVDSGQPGAEDPNAEGPATCGRPHSVLRRAGRSNLCCLRHFWPYRLRALACPGDGHAVLLLRPADLRRGPA